MIKQPLPPIPSPGQLQRTIAWRIKAERIRLNLTYDDFCPLDPGTVRRAEQGRGSPQIATLLIIARVLDCSIEYLAGLSDA